MHVRVADASETKAETRWKKAQSLYHAYEFQKAIRVLSRVVMVPPLKWGRVEKARALLYLSICHVNLGDKAKAESAFRRAYRYQPGIKIPLRMPKAIRLYYARLRSKLQAEAARRAVPRRRVTRPRVVVRRRVPPKRNLVLAVRRRPVPVPRRKVSYAPAVALMVTGVVVAGGAIGLAFASRSFDQDKQMIIKGEKPEATAGDLTRAYEGAVGTATASTILWGVAGASVITGVVTLFVVQ
jgi:hypothetical protein